MWAQSAVEVGRIITTRRHRKLTQGQFARAIGEPVLSVVVKLAEWWPRKSRLLETAQA